MMLGLFILGIVIGLGLAAFIGVILGLDKLE